MHINKTKDSQEWWYMPIIPELGGSREADAGR
jgi:hypothetical protein